MTSPCALQRPRALQRQTTTLGSTFQVSLCTYDTAGCRLALTTKQKKSTSVKMKAQIQAKLDLLEELVFVKYMPLSEAYDEYLGKLPYMYHPVNKKTNTAMQTFVDSILNADSGIPVLIVKVADNTRFVQLFEEAGSEKIYHSLKSLDRILNISEKDRPDILKKLSEHLRGHMELLTSARERAVVVSLLSTMFSPAALRYHLGFSEDYTIRLSKAVFEYSEAVDMKQKIASDEAEQKWKNAIHTMEVSLETQEDLIKKKRQRVSEMEIEDREQNICNLKERIERCTNIKKQYIRRLVATSMKTWKTGLMKQQGKGFGKHRIHRGAELAVFQTLQEQLTAHVKRTGMPEMEQRIHAKELRYIANKWLKEHGEKEIKSYETVRSWGKPRRKGSIQSKQHRGQNLFRRKRIQKTYTEEHINVHYNRAHIKNNTRYVFSKSTDKKAYTIRRCIDDKAYLRCGTSEGFSRPRSKPLVLAGDAPTLPSYDFPESAGYVSPGVILTIKDMEEKERSGRDTFATTDVVITVKCKPKNSYPSSSTNWANDMYANRLKFPEEHEVQDTGMQSIDRSHLTALVFLKDSMTQYALMTVAKDYERVLDSKDFCKRERHRLQILCQRILFVMMEVEPAIQDNQDISSVMKTVQEYLLLAENLEFRLAEETLNQENCTQDFSEMKSKAEEISLVLSRIVPQHRPIDFQTSDAGPGVGTGELIVRLRLTESFIINDLDQQMRFHYAPRDSKSHKVEQVMSSLNEACGDGRFIDIPYVSMVEAIGEENLLKMSPDDFKQTTQQQEREIGQSCAKKVAQRYTGTRCMGTTIHAQAPDAKNLYGNFHFDECYMKKCHYSSGKKKQDSPGIGYFEYLMGKFDEISVRYQNGFESIRSSGDFRCPVPLHRVPPPVPNYLDSSSEGKWHYYSLLNTPEEFTVENREVDNFCPVKKLKDFVNSVGEPNVQVTESPDGMITASDINLTWAKITNGIEVFSEKYVGINLHHAVKKEAEKLYLQKLHKAAKKLEKHKINVDSDTLMAIQTGVLKLKIKKTSVPCALPWNGKYGDTKMTNSCTVDNFLFFFHSVLTNQSDVKQYMLESHIPVYKILLQVHEHFSQYEFARGKYLWLSQFAQFEGKREINSHGSEDEFFLSKLRDLTGTTFLSECANKDCSQPVTTHVGSVMCYDGPDMCGAKGLQSGITSWLLNKKSRPCNKSTLNLSVKCSGSRSNQCRQFVNGLPVFLPIDVSNCPYSITNKLQIKGHGYKLQCVTYGNGGHFISNIKIGSAWYLYDGLKEYNRKQTGLVKQAKRLPLQGYRQNNVIYVKDILY